jgi:hypothetical protein
MSKLLKLVSPTALLYIYVILMQTARGIYLTSKIEPPPAYAVIDFFGLFWILGWWLLIDSRKRGIAWAYDMGFFLSVAWIFIMPYYLLKTRGAKGVLVILAFICVYIGAVLVGGTLYLVIALSTGRVTIG